MNESHHYNIQHALIDNSFWESACLSVLEERRGHVVVGGGARLSASEECLFISWKDAFWSVFRRSAPSVPAAGLLPGAAAGPLPGSDVRWALSVQCRITTLSYARRRASFCEISNLATLSCTVTVVLIKRFVHVYLFN